MPLAEHALRRTLLRQRASRPQLERELLGGKATCFHDWQMSHRKTRGAESALRSYALSLHEAYEEFPWGHRAIKVRRKIFAIMVGDDAGFRLSVKLPSSGLVALDLPFARPTQYGLGRSGWVTAQFAPTDRIPVQLLRDWIEESYRAIAPKRLLQRTEHPARLGTTRWSGRRRRSKRRAHVS